jgi:hypothetical protein
MPERALLVLREVERDPQVLSDRNEPIDHDSVGHARRVEQAHEAQDVAEGGELGAVDNQGVATLVSRRGRRGSPPAARASRRSPATTGSPLASRWRALPRRARHHPQGVEALAFLDVLGDHVLAIMPGVDVAETLAGGDLERHERIRAVANTGSRVHLKWG